MTLDENGLDDLLKDAARTYRQPPEPHLDAMWSRVETEAFRPAAGRRWAPGWRTFASAIAASLVLGVFAGRMITPSVHEAPAVAGVARVPAVNLASAAEEPYQRTTEDFLSRSAVLLTSLPASRDGSANARLSGQAAQLLTTTRLLLDSPVAADPKMKGLLEDLELVLAQVARIEPPRHRAELVLINQALQEHDLVPRIRSAVADLSDSER